MKKIFCIMSRMSQGICITLFMLVLGTTSSFAEDNCRRAGFNGPNPVFYLDKACLKAKKAAAQAVRRRAVAKNKSGEEKTGTAPVAKKAAPVRRRVVRSPKIRSIQRGLNRRGYAAGAVDGIMGKQTKTAILKYYRAKKLKNHGTIIDTVHLDLQGKLPVGNPKIWHLQKNLAAKGFKTGPATGKMNKQTRKAVMAYSRKYKLSSAYGSTMAKVSAHAAGKPMPQKPAPQVAASKMTGDPKIAKIQGLLNKAGYDVGEADGVLKKKTRMGIISYYKRRGLKRGSGTIMDTVLRDLTGARS